MIGRRPVLAAAGALAFRRTKAASPLTLITGAAAGSSADDIARAFAGFLEQSLPDRPVTVRNLPGDGGRTALAALAIAPPDGSHIGWVVSPVLPAREVDRADPTLRQRLTFLGAVVREPIAFVAGPGDPLTSVRDIIERASQDSGGAPLGTPPAGSPAHLAALRLQAMTQTKLNIIAFPSAAAARQALIGGNVSAAALGLSDVIGALRDSKLVGLGIAARNRSGIVPDLPVLAEAGVALSAWIRRGAAVPARTPPDIVAKLADSIHAATAGDPFREAAETLGLLAAWSDGPAWSMQMQREAAELTALWNADPWLNAAGQ